MNEAEAKVYKAFREVPVDIREKIERSGREALMRRNKEFHVYRHSSRIKTDHNEEQFYKALHKTLQDTPAFSGLIKLIDAMHPGPRTTPKPPPVKKTAPAAPFVKLGSVFVEDVPPFLTITDSIMSGDNSADAPPFANPDGTMGFTLIPGVTGTPAGSITAFAALGQLFAPQSSGLMLLGAAPTATSGLTWGASWGRTAAGSLTLEFIVSEFDVQGNFISDTVMATNDLIPAFSAGFGGGSQTPVGSQISMTGWMSVVSGNFYWCWVQLVGFAEANVQATFGSSNINLFAFAQLPSFIVYMP
jgi:hypothetical protein